MTHTLNGRSAETFTLMISERQFYIARHGIKRDELMALSSSGDTFLKCVSQMMFLGTGRRWKLTGEEETHGISEDVGTGSGTEEEGEEEKAEDSTTQKER